MRRKIAIATVTTAALIGTGGAVAFAQNDDSRPSARPSSSQQDGSTDTDDTAKAAKRTAAEAADIAQKAAPGTVTGIQLDDDRQGLVWEVDLTQGSTSHEVRLDADSGKVFFEEKEREEDAVPAGLEVSAADAARKAASTGTVTSVDIDDDSHNAWEVETTDANGDVQEVRVDAQSGKVTEGVSDDDGRDDDRYDDDSRHDDDRDDDGRYDDDSDDHARHDGEDDDRYDDSGRHGRHHGDDDGEDDGGRHGGSGRH